MEIVCQTEIAFELGYLTKDAFENISKKAKKPAVKMSNYMAANKKQYFNYISTTFQPHFNHISTTFQPHLQRYLNSVLYNINI